MTRNGGVVVPDLDDTCTRLAQALSRREGSAASEVVRSRSRSQAAGGDAEARFVLYDEVFKDISTAIDYFDEFRAFGAERRKTTAGIYWSKKRKKKSPKIN